jgi:hypothetical protein
MRGLRSLGAAIAVGILLSIFLMLWLHATWPFAIGASGALSVAIVAVVGTGSVEHDAAADDAWLTAAPDLPPSSDRRAMDAALLQMPGPEKGRRNGDGAAAGTAAGAVGHQAKGRSYR